MQNFSEPRFVLIDVHNVEDPDGNYWIVENFNPALHVSPFGGSRAGQTFFSDRQEVAHLRDRILN